jgi:hypothetical protein
MKGKGGMLFPNKRQNLFSILYNEVQSSGKAGMAAQPETECFAVPLSFRLYLCAAASGA